MYGMRLMHITNTYCGCTQKMQSFCDEIMCLWVLCDWFYKTSIQFECTQEVQVYNRELICLNILCKVPANNPKSV